MGKLSLPRMFFLVSGGFKNGFSSDIYLLEKILTETFPIMFFVSLMKPQYTARIFLSTRESSNMGLSILAHATRSV